MSHVKVELIFQVFFISIYSIKMEQIWLEYAAIQNYAVFFVIKDWLTHYQTDLQQT